MFRKLAIIASLLALSTAVMSVSAAGTTNPDPTANGCFVDNTLTTVNEGVAIPVTIKCVGIPIDNHVFGFQFGTSVTTGSFVAPTPSVYTAGSFTSSATGGAAGTFVGENSLALYGVSRKTTNRVLATDFTLGSFTVTAVTNRGTGATLTDADGSVAVTFNDTAFKLSDDLGESLDGWLRTVNDASTVVNDIDLAWLDGSAIVKSDSSAIGHIENVTLNLGAYSYTSTAMAASDHATLPIDVANLYVEDAAGVVGGTFADAQDSDNVLDIPVSADMWGHLACSTSAVDLGDVGASELVTGVTGIGTLGTITLKAGDVNADNAISNTDAVSIGLDFGDTGGDINTDHGTENDINLDGTVNIFDLVQVGRNFTALGTVMSACA